MSCRADWPRRSSRWAGSIIPSTGEAGCQISGITTFLFLVMELNGIYMAFLDIWFHPVPFIHLGVFSVKSSIIRFFVSFAGFINWFYNKVSFKTKVSTPVSSIIRLSGTAWLIGYQVLSSTGYRVELYLYDYKNYSYAFAFLHSISFLNQCVR